MEGKKVESPSDMSNQIKSEKTIDVRDFENKQLTSSSNLKKSKSKEFEEEEVNS